MKRWTIVMSVFVTAIVLSVVPATAYTDQVCGGSLAKLTVDDRAFTYFIQLYERQLKDGWWTYIQPGADNQTFGGFWVKGRHRQSILKACQDMKKKWGYVVFSIVASDTHWCLQAY